MRVDLGPLKTREESLLRLDPLGAHLHNQLLDQRMWRENSRKRDVLLVKQLMMHNLGEGVVFSRHFDGELSIFFPRYLDLHGFSEPARFGLLISSRLDVLCPEVVRELSFLHVATLLAPGSSIPSEQRSAADRAQG